jgi:hypothetical protein
MILEETKQKRNDLLLEKKYAIGGNMNMLMGGCGAPNPGGPTVGYYHCNIALILKTLIHYSGNR